MYGFYMDLIWVYTDSYGIIWICIWFDMDLIWIYMDLYGFIWIYIYVWILRGFCMNLIWNMDLYHFISFCIFCLHILNPWEWFRYLALSPKDACEHHYIYPVYLYVSSWGSLIISISGSRPTKSITHMERRKRLWKIINSSRDTISGVQAAEFSGRGAKVSLFQQFR